jgi:uncharacterized protein YdiU (UPF0061 family)
MNSPIFQNTYAQLPERFYQAQLPTPVTAPGLIRLNTVLAKKLGLDPDWLASAEGISVLAGNQIPAGAAPIATVYAGHQFGSWNPQLGDGRAVLLGEIIDPAGARFDMQLKGSGPTPYSRGGDGRAPLGPVLREYIVSEAMAALGIATTRSLAAVATGEPVYRESEMPGAVLARIAASHIRIGTFEFFAVRKDEPALKILADHVIARHYPAAAEASNPYLGLLEAVIKRVAGLVADWQRVGFIHGVLNTDNMLLSAETIDYGPCAFMDTFNPSQVYSSIDRGGRYAYNKQPEIAHWNLMVLAQSLLPLIHKEQEQAVKLARGAIEAFSTQFQHDYLSGMARKIGLGQFTPGDEVLIDDLLGLMEAQSLDFTLTFRQLSDPQQHAQFDENFAPWKLRWLARCQEEATKQPDYASMQMTNPICIPRNHLIEAAIKAATDNNDFSAFHALVDVLARPYDPQYAGTKFSQPPAADEIVQNTFCGT